ncbi:MAG: hypothetical protein M0O98_02880, partial [Acholeplasmataceae bacterium]|nr:hypothetical protein [Acholeplasmataceae bacterium]
MCASKKTALAAKMVPCAGLWVLQDVLFCALAFLFSHAAKISLLFFGFVFFGLLVTFDSLGEGGTFCTELQPKTELQIYEKFSIEDVYCRFCQTS